MHTAIKNGSTHQLPSTAHSLPTDSNPTSNPTYEFKLCPGTGSRVFDWWHDDKLANNQNFHHSGSEDVHITITVEQWPANVQQPVTLKIGSGAGVSADTTSSTHTWLLPAGDPEYDLYIATVEGTTTAGVHFSDDPTFYIKRIKPQDPKFPTEP